MTTPFEASEEEHCAHVDRLGKTLCIHRTLAVHDLPLPQAHVLEAGQDFLNEIG